MWIIMKRKYRTHFLTIELIISFILIGLVALVVYCTIGVDVFNSSLNEIRDVMYGTLAALSGAMLGFVITGLSVLLTTNSTKQIDKLKRSKHYKTIFLIFFSTSKYLGFLLLFSLISLVLDKDSNPLIIMPLITLWAMIIVTFRVLRCLWVLEKIIHLQIVKQ